MSFAIAVVRDDQGWSAAEVSLADAADLEDVADRLREVEPGADISLMFVESDDAYLVILRLDHGEDLRVFGSDVAFATESRLGALLLAEFDEATVEVDAADFEVRRSAKVGAAPGAAASAKQAAPDIDDTDGIIGTKAGAEYDREVDDAELDDSELDDSEIDVEPDDTDYDDSESVEAAELDDGTAADAEAERRAPGLGVPEPVGDADLLADLGAPASKLLELCTRDGMLPSDITAEVCHVIGCGDEVEELREA